MVSKQHKAVLNAILALINVLGPEGVLNNNNNSPDSHMQKMIRRQRKKAKLGRPRKVV